MTISSIAGKSADAFRTISEVAEALKIPQHVLRFWETRFTQIKPLKRAGGRRFYRPEDVELLGAIRQLLYGEGYTIKGVQRILREQGPRAVAVLARQHEAGSPADATLAADRPAGPQHDPTGTAVDEGVSAGPQGWASDTVAAVPDPAVQTSSEARPGAAHGRAEALGAASPGVAELLAELAAVLDDLERCRHLLDDARR